MKLPKSYIAKVPDAYKREYIETVCRENLLRMIVIAALLAAVEPLLAFFVQPPKSVSFYLALLIGLLGLLFVPVLLYYSNHIQRATTFCIMLVQSLFLSVILMGGIALSLYDQSWLASSSTYFLAVFAVAAFIIMPPAVSAVILLSFNLIFSLLLAQFQTESDVIITLNINTYSMTAAAWLLNQMVSRKEVLHFLNKKLIIDKNIELEKKNLELSELTMRDSMTNLLNHKNSLRYLREEVERAKRINYPLSVAMIDLDNFKSVNDNYGHQTGDEVLIQVAEILSESCRSTDVLGRYGGEEFIIIMPDTNDGDAAMLLRRIQNRIEETCFKAGIHITMSCGICELNGDSVYGVLKASDAMLYEAKKKGKNRVEVQVNINNKKSAAINE